jgi:divalent metal cation (Fe/Co/Zn/Cd) transporter
VVAAVAAAIIAGPGVRSVIHLRTLQLGPSDLLVTAKVEFDTTLGYAELSRTIDDAEARVRAAIPIARLIFLEPDVRLAG